MENRIDRNVIYPKLKTDRRNQINSCIEQIAAHLDKKGSRIIQQSFFIYAPTNEVYLEFYDQIFDQVKSKFNPVPSTSVIAQAPADGFLISVELISVSGICRETQINYKEESGIYYTILSSRENKELYAGGITGKKLFDPFSEQVEEAYKLLEAILQREGMDFANIARQWNYVENILSIHDIGTEHIQNYQLLNDVRSRYYSKSQFRNGYPSATGIGMNSGGLVLEVYAIALGKDNRIVPLKNPKQVDAYHYSNDVLIGDSLEKDHKKTTPKFERAKYVDLNGVRTVYISGTASVQNEVTLGVNDVEKQTWVTIENIANLINGENIRKAGINHIQGAPQYSFIRVYVKSKDDYEKVRKICDKYYGAVPLHYLIADVCRDNLLLEIEGVALIS